MCEAAAQAQEPVQLRCKLSDSVIEPKCQLRDWAAFGQGRAAPDSEKHGNL